MPRYGVTGSTGHLGPLVIAGMLGFGIAPHDIVAIARTPANAAALSEAGVEVRYGDWPSLVGVAVMIGSSLSRLGHVMHQPRPNPGPPPAGLGRSPLGVLFTALFARLGFRGFVVSGQG